MSNLSLADLLEKADPTPKNRVSSARAWLESLDERDRHAALRWIADGNSTACLWRTAREAGGLEGVKLNTFTAAIRVIRAEMEAAK